MSINSKKVLIAPLNWGLGHASRCIPIIRQNILEGNKVIIASDGDSLKLLKKEFPDLDSEELPPYGITYPKGKLLMWHLFKMSGKILSAINEEKRHLSRLVDKYQLDLIISDNRFGMYHKGVYSVYITHQTNIQAGKLSNVANRFHQHYMSRFNEIWIPDFENGQSLAGKLSEYDGGQYVKYIGALSRFKLDPELKEKNKILIIISGPEPQRSIFEDRVVSQIHKIETDITLVLGKMENKRIIRTNKTGNVTVHNFMTSDELEREMSESSLVVSRSGYSTIMDLKTLRKKAFFIPTPGQGEQLYLADYLKDKNICNYIEQDSFYLKDVVGLSTGYSGF